MDNEKIILLIVGAIIGFVVSLAKDWLMEGKKQKEKEKQFKREKLEKLYTALTKYSSLNLQFLSNYIFFLSKNENVDKFEKRFSKIDMDSLNELSKAKVLFSLYLFDELSDEYSKMNQIIEDFGKLQVVLISNYPDIDRIKLAKDIQDNMSKWITFMHDFEQSMPEIIKKF